MNLIISKELKSQIYSKLKNGVHKITSKILNKDSLEIGENG